MAKKKPRAGKGHEFINKIAGALSPKEYSRACNQVFRRHAVHLAGYLVADVAAPRTMVYHLVDS